jgi:transglutaminase-like putative cysteine protease
MSSGQLSRDAVLWQLFAVGVAVLPHLVHLPLWIPLLVVISLLWRFMAHLGRWSFPSRWIKLLFVIVTGLAVLFSYRAGGGISVTVSLLVVGFSLKTLEVYKQRDALVVLYVAYLVAATGFLFSQTILIALYLLAAFAVITSGLLSVYQLRPKGLLKTFKRSCLLLLPALPLMAVLFIGMPRFGPLWEVGLDRSAARTGLSETMSPGDISSLIRSPEVAFRATFEAEVPAQSQLYWRALVLNDFDGREWFNAQSVKDKSSIASDLGRNGFSYSLILEPTQKRYVPALAYPVVPLGTKLSLFSDATVEYGLPITSRQQFTMKSDPSLKYHGDLDHDQRKRLLHLPEGNVQSKQLALKWLAESDSEAEFVQKVLAYFNQSFSYSLQPPLLGRNSVDEFLFDTQIGFCGHFSSAAALLLRAAGIPARVVTGYQGGDLNPYENYIVVRQYDAHAWVEAWLDGRGWVRIDPTASVAPERIENAAEDVFSTDDGFLEDNPFYAFSLKSSGLAEEIRLRLEAINYGWHRWVLNYHHQQSSVLSSILGSLSAIKLAAFLLVPFALVIGVTVLLLIRKGRPRASNVYDREVFRLSEKLKIKGLSRAKGETVNAYCARLSNVMPASSQLFVSLAGEYERARYAEAAELSGQEFSRIVDQCIGVFRSH